MPNVAAVRSPQVSGLQGLVANARYFLTQRTYAAALCAEAVLWPTDTVLMNDGTGNLQSIALPAVALSGSYNDLSDQPTIPDDAAARIAGDNALAAQIATLTAGSPAELNTFLEAYNRFLSGESAASTNVAAIAAEATARASAVTSEANARTSGDATNAAAITAEASARAAAVTNEAAARSAADTTNANAITALAPHRETVTLDFGYAGGNGEGDIVRATMSAPYVSATSRIVCLPSPADSADHSTDETLLEDIRFSAVNIVPSTSFDIVAVAPSGTWGRHDCVAIVQ